MGFERFCVAYEELSDFLKYSGERNEFVLPCEVISTGLGSFFGVVFISFFTAQLKLFEMSTEHCLEKKMNQLFISEIGPEPASVPFKKFIL